MFENVGEKLRVIAMIFFALGVLGSIVCGIMFLCNDDYIVAVLVAILGSTSVYLTSLYIYAFGELVDNSDITIRNLNQIKKMIDNYSVGKNHVVSKDATRNEKELVKERKINSSIIIPVVNYYANLNFRIYEFVYDSNEQNAMIKVCTYENVTIKAMNIDIILNTIFDTTYTYGDINITNINDNQTEKIDITIPENQLKVVKSVSIVVNRYVDEEQSHINCDDEERVKYSESTLEERRRDYGNDVVTEYEKLSDSWRCICGRENDNTTQECSLCKRTYDTYKKSEIEGKLDVDILIEKLDEFKSCKEIYTYLIEEKILTGTKDAEELRGEIFTMSYSERMYGNMKRDCIELIKKHYDLLEE